MNEHPFDLEEQEHLNEKCMEELESKVKELENKVNRLKKQIKELGE